MRTRLALLSAAGGALLAAAVAVPAYAVTGPVARDDSYNTATNTNLVIGSPGVLSNDTDAAGGTLVAALTAGAQHGSVSLSANGAFNYVPTTNYSGSDQFTYTVKADDGIDTATVFITVNGAITTTTPVPPPVGGVVIYPTCAAAFRAGVHDIPRSDPRYRLVLDRDRDGIACEQNGDDTRPIVTQPPVTTVVTQPPATTIVTQPPVTNTVVAPAPAAPNTVVIVPPAPSGGSFTSPIVPSGPVATGDGSLANVG